MPSMNFGFIPVQQGKKHDEMADTGVEQVRHVVGASSTMLLENSMMLVEQRLSIGVTAPQC